MSHVVVAKGFVNLSLKEDLAERIDEFIDDNDWGFTNRAEVVTAAVREFLKRESKRPENPNK